MKTRLPGYTPSQLPVTDTINRATQAAFSASLTHSAPLVAGPSAWGAAPSSGPQSTATVYTFTYTNNGAAAGQIYLRDVLPAGMTYQPNTAVWSSNPGVALLEAGAFGGSSPTDEIAYKVSGQTIEALIKNVAAGESGTLSFKAIVTAGAPVGPLTSLGLFSSESCVAANLTVAANGTGCGPAGTTNTTATFTVLANRGVQLGPVLDTVPGTPAGVADAVTVTNVTAGGAVNFVIPVKNTGNASDTFKMAVDTTGMTFPSGTQFTWFAIDGVTPLQNSVGGIEVDTGPVAAGATVNVILRASLPAAATVANNANLTVKAVARSFNDATKLDAVSLAVTNVVAGLVEVTSTLAGTSADIGPGALLNTVSQSLFVTAGGAGQTSSTALNAAAGTAVYDLYVKNNDSALLTFSLESSLTTSFPGNPPSGWTIRYYLFNTNVATSLAGTAVSQVPVAAGAQAHVLAVVTPLASSSDVAALDLYFRARSTAAASGGAIVNDSVRTQISVTAPGTKGFILSPAGGSRQTAASSVADFAHTLLNNGTQTCGVGVGGLKLTAVISPAQTGADPWKVVLYQDNGSVSGQIDSGDTLLPTDALGNVILPLPSLAAGASYPLIARVYSPSSGASGGTGISVVLTVADQDAAPNCGSQSITNTVSVTVGQLVVNKWQRYESSVANVCATVSTDPSSTAVIDAKPGDCIVYRAEVKNNGIAPVKNVSLHDVVPPFTKYHAVQAPMVQCVASGLTGAAATLTAPPSGTTGALSCGSSTNELSPGGTITLRFRVQINPN